MIPNSRLGYPKLWVAAGINGDPDSKPRFGCQILLPKTDTKTKAAIDSEIARITKEKFQGKPLKSSLLCIRDGDIEGDDNTAGHWVIGANRAVTQGRPSVVDRNPSKALLPDDGKPYAGCYCNFLVGIYATTKFGSRICASLEIVQFDHDGEPFGSARPSAAVAMQNLADSTDEFEV